MAWDMAQKLHLTQSVLIRYRTMARSRVWLVFAWVAATARCIVCRCIEHMYNSVCNMKRYYRSFTDTHFNLLESDVNKS